MAKSVVLETKPITNDLIEKSNNEKSNNEESKNEESKNEQNIIKQKLENFENVLGFLSSAYAICPLCKGIVLKQQFAHSNCFECKMKACNSCLIDCATCKRRFCEKCSGEKNFCVTCYGSLCKVCLDYCSKCNSPLCRLCENHCYVCKNESKKIKFHWMDGSVKHVVKPNGFMTTKEPLPQFCKVKLKLHDDIPDCACVGITNKQYNNSDRIYSCGGLTESIECGWHWCSCG